MTSTAGKSIVDQIDFGPRPELDPPPMPRRPDDHGLIARIEMAAQQNEQNAVKALFQRLIELPDGEYWSCNLSELGAALSVAVESNNPDVVAFLLDQGVQPTVHDAQRATKQKNFQLLEHFMSRGWDINEPRSWHKPPLLAQVLNDSESLSFFLSHGANPNAKGTKDHTALSDAVRYCPLSTIRLLFDYGASVDHGQPLHWAVIRDLPDAIEVVEYLLEKGAAVNKIMYEDAWESFVSELGAALGTPLHEAAGLGKLDIVRFLVEKHGANLLIEDSYGGTPLQVAEKAKQASVVAYLYPLMATATPPEHQFTRPWRMQGWERYYAPAKTDHRL